MSVSVRELSRTKLAKNEFLDRVKHIEGTEVYTDDGKSDYSLVVVVVQYALGPVARQVIEVQGDIHRKYKGAALIVQIKQPEDIEDYIDDLVKVAL